MEIAIIIFLSFTTISFFIVSVCKERELRIEKDIRKQTVNEWIIRQQKLIDRHNSRQIELRTEMLKIQRENIRLVELMKCENSSSPKRISKDTIDAVFYAMKKSHPDNGGKEEDFIRFKNCYEELTRK